MLLSAICQHLEQPGLQTRSKPIDAGSTPGGHCISAWAALPTHPAAACAECRENGKTLGRQHHPQIHQAVQLQSRPWHNTTTQHCCGTTIAQQHTNHKRKCNITNLNSTHREPLGLLHVILLCPACMPCGTPHLRRGVPDIFMHVCYDKYAIASVRIRPAFATRSCWHTTTAAQTNETQHVKHWQRCRHSQQRVTPRSMRVRVCVHLSELVVHCVTTTCAKATPPVYWGLRHTGYASQAIQYTIAAWYGSSTA